MEEHKVRWPEILTILGAGIAQVIFVSFLFGRLDARVTTLEQLRLEARADTASQIAEIKGQMNLMDRKLDRLLERK